MISFFFQHVKAFDIINSSFGNMNKLVLIWKTENCRLRSSSQSTKKNWHYWRSKWLSSWNQWSKQTPLLHHWRTYDWINYNDPGRAGWHTWILHVLWKSFGYYFICYVLSSIKGWQTIMNEVYKSFLLHLQLHAKEIVVYWFLVWSEWIWFEKKYWRKWICL